MKYIHNPNNLKADKIWNMYNTSEKAFVKYIFPYSPWKLDKVYSDIKCIWFEYCDRGIKCWKKFSEFLKTCFPNLRSVILCQNYSYSKCGDELEETHFLDFFYDPWLSHIWIEDCQTSFIKKERTITDNLTRVLNSGYICETVSDCAVDESYNCQHRYLNIHEHFMKKDGCLVLEHDDVLEEDK
jgi:hypothetical protein